MKRPEINSFRPILMLLIIASFLCLKVLKLMIVLVMRIEKYSDKAKILKYLLDTINKNVRIARVK
jgi:hypothetical protein